MPTKVQQRKGAGQKEMDPVCGMQVETKGAISGSHQGAQYFFCSEECRQQFEINPSAFARQTS